MLAAVQNSSQAGQNSLRINADRHLGKVCAVLSTQICWVGSSRGIRVTLWPHLPWESSSGAPQPETPIPHLSETFCLKLLPQGFLHVLYLLRDHRVTEVIAELLFQQHPDDFDAAFVHHGLRLPERVAPPPRDGVALDVVGGEELVEQSLAGRADFLVETDGLFELFLGVAVEELHHLAGRPVGLLLEGEGFQPLHLLLQREDILLQVQDHPLQLLYLLPEKLKPEDKMGRGKTAPWLLLNPSSTDVRPASEPRTRFLPECLGDEQKMT